MCTSQWIPPHISTASLEWSGSRRRGSGRHRKLKQRHEVHWRRWSWWGRKGKSSVGPCHEIEAGARVHYRRYNSLSASVIHPSRVQLDVGTCDVGPTEMRLSLKLVTCTSSSAGFAIRENMTLSCMITHLELISYDRYFGSTFHPSFSATTSPCPLIPSGNMERVAITKNTIYSIRNRCRVVQLRRWMRCVHHLRGGQTVLTPIPCFTPRPYK